MNDIPAESVNEWPPKADILDVAVSALTMQDMLALIRRSVASKLKLRAAFCTVHTVTECQTDHKLMTAINGCQVVCPDGMPLVWLTRRSKIGNVSRVYGPDTLLACTEDGLALNFRHYFYGSTPDVLSGLISQLKQAMPSLQVAGSYSPPFRDLTPEEDAAITRQINETEPDIVWVGLGMPKQEIWAADHQHLLNAPVVLPVGAAFAFHAGAVKQAPKWMQRSGFEWLYRLVQEPRRLWRRYILGNSRFVILLAGRAIRRKS